MLINFLKRKRKQIQNIKNGGLEFPSLAGKELGIWRTHTGTGLSKLQTDHSS